ncbi:right-handed parallel beta-helix repeat-containing protein [Bacillus solimangrovi]|uniref:Right handed beta helix domain-containing protein n=1 Tax=Bacillus solimangrovi TaxID=1305675 RepID=A0A1E5LEF7_9BACI|nr:right-handed parallel beta-helix repeat-containing protein [Bacillus solimangrovi]OEH92450.1 hypothetical protein BFG57_15830 [Bacillus solimangrovi]
MAIIVVPTDFPTVQAAIDDGNTNAGDTIKILSGTFDGFEVTKERLKIFGCGIEKTIITGQPADPGGNGVVVLADQTILQGFTAQGLFEEGVVVESNHNVLTDIESNFNIGGFQIKGSHNLIHNCSASFNEGVAVEINGLHNCTIKCNSSDNKEVGFNFVENFNIAVNIRANRNGNNGIEIDDEFLILVKSTALKNAEAGIAILGSNNNIIGNFACNNMGSGIGIDGDFINNVIDTNIVRNNGTSGTGSGILVGDDAMDNAIRFNKLKLNTPFDLEVLGDPANNTFDGNKCTNSEPFGLCDP